MAYQHVHQDDVPRFDQVAQRGFSRYSFNPQVRQLARARVDQQTPFGLARTIGVNLAWHRSSERRERQRSASSLFIVEEDVVDTLGLTAEATARPASRVLLRYGVEVYRDHVASDRTDLDTSTGASTARRGLYPDGARASSVAAFFAGTLDAGATSVDGGIRASRYAVRADDPQFGKIALSPRALVGHAAVSHAFAPSLRAFLSVSQAFRAPNVDDASALGPFDFGIEVPSPWLKPERSLAAEAGFKVRVSWASLTFSAYRMNLEALIDRVRSQLDGQEF